jgi:hypothetical protein
MSNLIDHAERELALLGNDEAMNQGILAMVAVFSTMGHSGSSAEYTTQVLARLLRYENLSPLTDDPDEWNHISDGMMPEGSEPTWQCRRNSEAFSHDGGKTYYLLSERFTDEGNVRKDEKIMHTSFHVEPKPPIELTTAQCCECMGMAVASLGCECQCHWTEPITPHTEECSRCGKAVPFITDRREPGGGYMALHECVPATMMQPVDISFDDEQPAKRELTGQFTIGLDDWTCTIDGCTATSKDADENLTEHLRTHGIEVTEVMGVPIPPVTDKPTVTQYARQVLVHDPQCAVAMNPGLMSAWMFCHCKPVKED